MSNKVLETSDATFEQDILSGLVLVDFWAEWCGPCQVMIPRLNELAEKMGDKAKIMKMNVDQSPTIPQRFRIMSIPTMMIFKNGKLASAPIVGTKSVEELEVILLGLAG